MSVVACKIYDNGFVMGADSQITRGSLVADKNMSAKKICEVNNMVIGSVGVLEECCLIELFALTHKPINATNRDVLAFIVEFVEYKQKITNKYEIKNDFLIGYKGIVFYVNDFLVSEVNKHESIGSGSQKAITALHLGYDVEESLKITCELDIFCAEPIILFDKRMKEVK